MVPVPLGVVAELLGGNALSELEKLGVWWIYACWFSASAALSCLLKLQGPFELKHRFGDGAFGAVVTLYVTTQALGFVAMGFLFSKTLYARLWRMFRPLLDERAVGLLVATKVSDLTDTASAAVPLCSIGWFVFFTAIPFLDTWPALPLGAVMDALLWCTEKAAQYAVGRWQAVEATILAESSIIREELV